MIRLRFRGQANLMVGVGVLGEAGIAWTPVGGNEVDVDALDGLDAEQLDELAALVRDPFPSPTAVHPPVAAPDTIPAVGVVGEEPPRAGQGSSRAAWVAHAAELTAAGIPVVVTDTMGRDEIVAAVDKAMEAHRGS